MFFLFLYKIVNFGMLVFLEETMIFIIFAMLLMASLVFKCRTKVGET